MKKLSFILLACLLIACTNIKEKEAKLDNTQIQVLNIEKGQFDPVFPDKNMTTRIEVQNSRQFKMYKNQGKLFMDNLDVDSADIYINGKKLVLNSFPKGKNVIDISSLTVDGINTLEVRNIEPKEKKFFLTVNYPVVNENYLYDNFENSKKFKAVIEQLKKDVESGFPGGQLVVIQNGNKVLDAVFGYSELYDTNGKKLDNPIKVNKNTLFDLASNTKMYATNFAIMKLVDEKKINLKDKINKFFPEFKGEWKDEITIEMLLSHSSGLGPEVLFFNPNNKHGIYSQDVEKTKQIILKKVPIENEPMTKQVYSDTGFMLLGMVVEKISGKPLDQYVEEEFYKPLALETTVFNPLNKLKDKDYAATELEGNRYIRGYEQIFPNMRMGVIKGTVDDDKAFHSLGGVAGHAGLFSTANQVATLGQIVLNDGGYGDLKFFDKNTISKFTRASDLGDTFALGWNKAVMTSNAWMFSPYASEQAIGHTGFTGTLTIIDPKYDLVIVLLTNKLHSPYNKDIKNNKYSFTGNSYETGKYGTITTLIYKALLHNNK